MSIIWGIREAEGQAVGERQLRTLASRTDRYAPDGTFVRANGRVGMGFQPYYTHQRSQLESQPSIDGHGNMLAFDGRLDNHRELSGLLNIQESAIADSMIVLAAFERWGDDCFSRLVGDWALALWSHQGKALYLARDHAGTRTLFFDRTDKQVLWSTYLETFFVDQKRRDLDESFAACYLACQPIRDLTPYKNIRAVRPGHCLKFDEEAVTSMTHWKCLVKGPALCKTDEDYEEQFFHLFQQAVQRRVGPGAPVLAQLSGGVDSTSIVCMSDYIRRQQGATSEQLLDTVSYYNESEPDWDEKPYFTITEKSRGKTGIHVSLSTPLMNLTPSDRRSLLPGFDHGSIEREQQFEASVEGRGYRTIVSGLGGDELLGGVPTPMPELANYLISGQLVRLLQRTTKWCIATRSPLIHMLVDVSGFTYSLYRRPTVGQMILPPWMSMRAMRLNKELLSRDARMFRSLTHEPSAISNELAWWSVLETLPHLFPRVLTRYEFRYPYLDRDLVEFLFQVPRVQLVEPGRRRSLMRRSLKTIVPHQILERRRKAFLSRRGLFAFQSMNKEIRDYFRDSLLASSGLIVESEFFKSLDRATAARSNEWSRQLRATVSLEHWMREEMTTHQPCRSE